MARKIAKQRAKKIVEGLAFEDKIIFFLDYINSDKSLEEYIDSQKIVYREGKDEETKFITEACNQPIAYEILSELELKKLDENKLGYLSSYNVDRLMDLYRKINEYVIMIANGVDIGYQNKRPFDILDFYEYIGMDPEKFVTCIKILKKEATPMSIRIFTGNDLVQLREAKFKNDPCFVSNEDVIINGAYYVNAKPGMSEKELEECRLSEEVIKKIISYIKAVGAPVSYKVFNTAFKRYGNGQLDLEKHEKIKIKESV